MKRTHNCGELRSSDISKKVILCGWVHTRRDHGGVIFVDLRDRYGIVQIVFNKGEILERAKELKSEYVILVEGIVGKRPEGTINKNLSTGEIEIVAEKYEILNISKTPPFEITQENIPSEEVRLKYRYIDLRSERMKKNIILRHDIILSVRNFLSKNNFLDIETPLLTKSTPEGARDFLVPSRLEIGHFFALPQSPQLFKQILMVAGFDRYFQIAKCFRDEDLRSDRQPEFTQIDVEMSFIDEDDIIGVIEGMLKHVWRVVLNKDVKTPFPRLTYDEAISKYGLDKPDTRFEMELSDATEIVKNSNFEVFTKAIKQKGIVKALNAKGCADFSRKELDELTAVANSYGAKGLAWVKITSEGLPSNVSIGGWQSPIAKFLTDDEKNGIAKTLDANTG